MEVERHRTVIRERCFVRGGAFGGGLGFHGWYGTDTVFDDSVLFGHALLVLGVTNFVELQPAVAVLGGTAKSESHPANGGGQRGSVSIQILE